MVRAIVGTGTLVDANGRPAANLVIALQVLTLKSDWKAIAQSRTGRRGDFKIEAVTEDLRELTVAPRLRLAGGRGEVLAEDPPLELVQDKLQLDFGSVTRGSDSDSPVRRLKAVQHELRSLKVEKNTLAQRFHDAEQARNAVEHTRDDLAGQLAERNVRLQELEVQLGDTARPQSGPLDEATTQEFSRLKLRLLGSETELRQQTAQAQTLTARIDSLTSERDALAVELDELRDAETAAPPIGTLATTIASSLRGIDAEGVELADARITLRGYLAGAGDRFKPFDAAELARADLSAASEISFGVRPGRVGTDNNDQTMPDVIGLTPASARRILRPLGRRIDVVEARGKPVGAITRQTPGPGKPLSREASIRLLVAIGPEEA